MNMKSENSEQSRVFFLPNPGGSIPSSNHDGVTHYEQNEILYGSNPLLKISNSLLKLVSQIRTLVQVTDQDELKKYLISEIKKFEHKARQLGIDHEQALIARYCLCTVLDETAAKTPWGKEGNWSKHSLLVIFHNETWGGEKFFQFLAKALESPENNIDLIELMYYCISFGFQGRYNVTTNGESNLENIRLKLSDKIRQTKGAQHSGLSINWKGEPESSFKIWNIIPVWVTSILSTVIAAGIFLVFLLFLSERADTAFMSLANLTLPEPPKLYREHSPSKLSDLLEEEIENKTITVRETNSESIITILGDGLYESASSDIRSSYLPTLKNISEALNQIPGDLEVIGHTDNLPIRTIRYPSNWELSVDRAKNVADILKKNIAYDREILIQGKASAEPITDNSTIEGRRLNRRVEIILYTHTTT